MRPAEMIGILPHLLYSTEYSYSCFLAADTHVGALIARLAIHLTACRSRKCVLTQLPDGEGSEESEGARIVRFCDATRF